MPRKPVRGESLVAYTLNIPEKHMEEIRVVANEQSSPQKQVKPAEVARSIVAEWYEKRKQSSHA